MTSTYMKSCYMQLDNREITNNYIDFIGYTSQIDYN